jgi:hypothetical protein
MTSFFDHLDLILYEGPLFCQVKEKILGTVVKKVRGSIPPSSTIQKKVKGERLEVGGKHKVMGFEC